MTNDAKLGLVVGLGVVLAVAIFFARKEPLPTEPPAQLPRQSAPASGVSRTHPAPPESPPE